MRTEQPGTKGYLKLTLSKEMVFKTYAQRRTWLVALLCILLASAALYKAVSFLVEVTDYPFSLGWSEASRFYYASLFFSRDIYGIWAPLSVLHPSRYLMQAVPFLLPGSPIWFHRLWQVFLWIALPLVTVFGLARRVSVGDRVKDHNRLTATIFILWAFLFLFQGPVYYHLLVMAALVLWGYDSQRFWKSLAIVLFASAWAGISRINWLPVPGLLASALYLLERDIGQKSLARYALPPVLWAGSGTITGFAIQKAYESLSGNLPEYFGSSFSSDLLWYRLLPSETYPLGVLPAIALAAGPLMLLALACLTLGWRRYHWLRLSGLGAILSVLFVGGTLVSVKIGGGSNLHNLDAFLVLLLVIGSAIYFGRFIPEGGPPSQSGVNPWTLTMVALIVPALFSFSSGISVASRDPAGAQKALAQLQEIVDQKVSDGGQILFISERHLLTFHFLKNMPLVPEYENVFLMEMAMANNRPYLEAFYRDLKKHRFALIASYPISIQYQGRTHQFGEENDAWVDRVALPLLDCYQLQAEIPEIPLQLYTPKEDGSDCP